MWCRGTIGTMSDGMSVEMGASASGHDPSSRRGSSRLTVTAIVVLPPLMMSPSSRSTTRALRSLTKVPLVLAMSISRQQGGLTSIMKWTRQRPILGRELELRIPGSTDDEGVVFAKLEHLSPVRPTRHGQCHFHASHVNQADRRNPEKTRGVPPPRCDGPQSAVSLIVIRLGQECSWSWRTGCILQL